MPSSNNQNHRARESIAEPNCVALEILYRAHRYAIDTASDPWEFAVDISDLEQAGVTKSEFRWLLAHGFAEHAEDITLDRSSVRQFAPLGKHQFTSATCFVLREKGVRFIEHGRTHAAEPGSSSVPDGTGAGEGSDDSHSVPAAQNGHPVWNRAEKQLMIREVIVKRFRWPAPNQELVLEVFEEEGWPSRIDDPLPKVPEQEPRRRLQDAIKSLNRNQENRLIVFRGDGTGEGVIWELLEPAKPSRAKRK